MTQTRDKLDEARYFLERMEETQGRDYSVTQRKRDAFKYDLVAFLSATRSITFLMQKEFKKAINGSIDFETWYSTHQSQMKNDITMRFLLEQRNIAIHQGSVRLHSSRSVHLFIDTDLVASIFAATEEDEEEMITAFTVPQPPVPDSKLLIKHSWVFDKLNERGLQSNVIAVCEDHIEKLERLVDECESLFIPSMP